MSDSYYHAVLKFVCFHYSAHCFNKLKGTLRHAVLCTELLGLLQISTLIAHTKNEGQQLKYRGAQARLYTLVKLTDVVFLLLNKTEL